MTYDEQKAQEIAEDYKIEPGRRYNTKEVCRILGLTSTEMVARLCRSGRLKACRAIQGWEVLGKWLIEHISARCNF
jgi:hypothetical protein